MASSNTAEKIDVKELMAAHFDDDLLFFRDCLVIRDHDTSQLLPFVLNKGQQILHNIAEKQKAETGRVRIVLLKSRRFGGSTYVEGRFYKKTTFDMNRNTFIVAHEEDATTTLFRMAQLFQEKNPYQPSVLASNAKELRFDVTPQDYKKGKSGLKSEYRLATAKNAEAGRSQGIHFLHISEEGMFGSNARDLLTGLIQCVPKPPAYTEIWRESTAKGFGNTFQEAVFKTFCEGKYPYYEENGQTFAWKNTVSDWTLVFIPWNIIEKYKMEIPKNERDGFIKKINEKIFDANSLKWVDSEELTIKKKFRLSYEQLYWRKWTIENDCQGSLDVFNQEYPLTVESAFLSTGSNVFDKALCDELEANCREPDAVGDIVRNTGRSRLKLNKHGKLSVWEKYEKGEAYFITVDVAGGLKQGQQTTEKKQKKEPDKTNIDVWNHRTGMMCAQWNGHIDYDLVADMVSLVGDMYATIDVRGRSDFPPAIVELNNHGYSVVDGLNKINYPQRGNMGDEPGWLSNRRTKPQMIDSLYKAVRDGTLQIMSKPTVSEMRTYIEEGGHYNSASGCKDDRVITAAIASQMILLLPRKFKTGNKNYSGSNARFTNLDGNEAAKPKAVYYA